MERGFAVDSSRLFRVYSTPALVRLLTIRIPIHTTALVGRADTALKPMSLSPSHT